jgi:DNA-binding XRE family transcriptional regulator
VGQDTEGRDFGVGTGSEIELAEAQLRSWIMGVLIASANDAQDGTRDLSDTKTWPALEFSPEHLFPIALRRQRVLHSLTQKDLAERLGISQQAYAYLESLGSNPRLKTIHRLEQALGVDFLYLNH